MRDLADGRPWLTPIEVERLTGRSRKAVYEALWSGELDGYQKCKRGAWTVPRSAVDAWMAKDQKAA